MAVAVPLKDAGLGMAGLARGAGAYEGLARPAEMGEQFPPLPAVPSAVPDQAGLLPDRALHRVPAFPDRGAALLQACPPRAALRPPRPERPVLPAGAHP